MWSYPSSVRQWKSMVAAGFISGWLGCVEVVRGWLRLWKFTSSRWSCLQKIKHFWISLWFKSPSWPSLTKTDLKAMAESFCWLTACYTRSTFLLIFKHFASPTTCWSLNILKSCTGMWSHMLLSAKVCSPAHPAVKPEAAHILLIKRLSHYTEPSRMKYFGTLID